MRKLLLLLLTACLLLSGCTARDPIAPMLTDPVEDQPIPSAASEASIPREAEVTLWFRFGTEPVLAPEIRTIDVSPTAPFEATLLQALANGPAAASTELSGLFPPGTRVLATHLQGRTLFVTLSPQIMNDFADEPAAWASQPEWAVEVPLRRQLAMQAIAATVTENCDVDQVVILVEQTARGSDSLRLRQQYYRTGADDGALAAPLTRDEAPLLTPANTLRIILGSWQARDWSRLVRYTARTDGSAKPGYDAFAVRADALPHLTGFTASEGNVSPDGQTARFTVTLELLVNGRPVAATCTIRLERERGLWRVSLDQLEGREGDLP